MAPPAVRSPGGHRRSPTGHRRSPTGHRRSPASKRLFAATPGEDELDAVTNTVHFCLQRERGATCAWVSGGGERYRELTAVWRGHVDRAGPSEFIAVPLMEVRAAADEAAAAVTDGSASPEAAADGFYEAFRRFNELNKAALLEEEDKIHAALAAEEAASRLTALLAFIRLKEAAGIERAFLCGALALPEAALQSVPPRAFAALVVALNEHSAHKEQLHATAPSALLAIIGGAFDYPEDLARVQRSLYANFDVRAVRAMISLDQWFDLISAYIDRLNRLQALLLAEAASPERSDTAEELSVLRRSAAALARTFGSDTESAAAIISSMSADDVKEGLLDALRSAADHEDPFRSPPSSPDAPAAPGDALGGGAMSRRITLDEISFERKIGRGGSGTTYTAQLAGRRVAVKVSGGVDFRTWQVRQCTCHTISREIAERLCSRDAGSPSGRAPRGRRSSRC